MKRALLIEDTEEVRTLIRSALPEFDCIDAKDISRAKTLLQEQHFDIVLLDIHLPDGDGLRFYSDLQADPSPKSFVTMVVSGKSDLDSKILAFSLGVEDFIAKPFHPVEFRARVLAKVRKAEQTRSVQDCLNIGDVEMRLSEQKAYWKTKGGPVELDLTSRQFKVLLYLIRANGRICSREKLLDSVWGASTHVIDRTVDTHVSHLRKKLSRTCAQIEAVPGEGYRLVCSDRSVPRFAATH